MVLDPLSPDWEDSTNNFVSSFYHELETSLLLHLPYPSNETTGKVKSHDTVNTSVKDKQGHTGVSLCPK